jgi:hypothetical protein
MSTLYCPKCASQIVEGQRFCRACGTNLGLILDAIAGKRGGFDFESLKADLLQLGIDLRTSFEDARASRKKTQRFAPSAGSPADAAPRKTEADWEEYEEKHQELIAELESKLKEKRGPRSRKSSLQLATLSILSGAATCAVLGLWLDAAASSGLLYNIEQVLVRRMEMPEVTGWAPVLQLLWLIGLIPVAKGFAHLINGIFFAPKPEAERPKQPLPAPGFVKEMPDYFTPNAATTTNELKQNLRADFPPSVTEEPTAQFVPQKTVTSDQ